MGEMADLYLDQMFDELDDYLYEPMGDYHEGDFFNPSWGGSRQRKPKCKYCGKKALHWVQLSKGWRLHEQDGKVHECPKHPSKKIKPVYEPDELLERCLKYLPDHLDSCPKLTQYNNPPCKCRNESHKILKNIIKEHLKHK